MLKKFFNRQRCLGIVAGMAAVTILFSGLILTPAVRSMLSGSMSETPMINNIQCYIGYGIDVLNAKDISFDNLKDNWLTSKAFERNSGLITGTGNIEGGKIKSAVHTGDSVSEISSNMDIKAGLDIKTPFFTAGLIAKYGTSSDQKHTARYANTVTTVDLYKFNMDGRYLTRLSRLRDANFIDAFVLEDINDPGISPEKLFEYYGTHMITEQTSGARANFYYTYQGTENISSQDFSAAINASSKFFETSASAAVGSKEKTITQNCKLTINVMGGDVRTVAKATIEEASKGFNDWGRSVNAASAVLSDIHALMPIWEFANDAVRRNEIKSTFERLAVNRTNELDLMYINRSGQYVEPPIKNGGKYVFQNFGTLQAIDAPNPNPNLLIQQLVFWEAHSGTNQQWIAYAVPDAPGCFFFKNVKTGLYMDVDGGELREGGKASNGRKITQYASNGSKAQKFKVVTNTDGSISLISMLGETHRVAGASSAIQSNGDGIVLMDSTDSRGKWKVTKID